MLPGAKVTAEIAQIRGIPEGRDSISPNRHRDISNMNELLEKVAWIRDLTGRPVGVKTAVGGWRLMNEAADIIHRRGLEFAPDFLVIDGGEGGSGAAPQALADHMGLSIEEALPRVVDSLIETGLRSRIRVVASGKIVTSARAAWALCVGADFINTARGFMFSLGCIQALRCHQNTCPTGVTTHNKRLQRALVVEEKYLRVANYAMNMNKEIDMIAHSCGVRHARELHARARAHRAGERPVDGAQHALSVSGAQGQDEGGVIRLLLLLVPMQAFALSPAAQEFMTISKELEPVQCEKRQLRRKIALAEAERRDGDAEAARARFATLNKDPKTTRLEKRLAELEPRLRKSSDPEDLQAISLQQREAFYRCE